MLPMLGNDEQVCYTTVNVIWPLKRREEKSREVAVTFDLRGSEPTRAVQGARVSSVVLPIVSPMNTP